MNKYTAAALAAAARHDGRRILVVAPRVGRDVYPEFVPFAMGDDVPRRSQVRITYASGGEIWFVSPRSNGERGRSVDTVYIDDRDAVDPRRYAPCVAASPTGEVILA